MKYLLFAFFLLSASFAFCAENVTVPNTFKEGDIVSAEKMNQNFQKLAEELAKLKASLAQPARPTVSSVKPENGQKGISLSSDITINFNGAMDTSTIVTANTLTGSNITLQDSSGNHIQAAITFSNQVATINPASDLRYSETYTVTVSIGVSDSSGNALGMPFTSNFQTVLNTPTSISAGMNHTCATYFDNTIKCSGQNSQGSLGNGTGLISLSPVNVTGITNATAVSNASAYSCALLADKTIRCWGRGWNGVMGDGSSTSWYVPANKVSGITTATEVSTAGAHACALLSTGTVQCWGGNFYGSLGGGQDNVSMNQLTPINVSKISNATSITTGGLGEPLGNLGFSCALLSAGIIKCWGNDNYGQLGSGSRNSTTYTSIHSTQQQTGFFSREPVQVAGISNATAISASRTGFHGHACAIVDQGSVKCWGADDSGQLGSGSRNTETYTQNNQSPPSQPITQNASYKPVSVSGINTAIAISAGGRHTCALLADKTVKCWGADDSGQLGSGAKNTETYTQSPNNQSQTQNASYKPVSVSGINTAIAISAGGSHTCALLEDKTVKCWGNNQSGQFGDGLGASSLTPKLTLF